MKTNYYLILVFLIAGLSLQAQKGKQKKADRLYNDLAYFEAVEVYKELIENDYNTVDNKQKLADSYLQLRSPENAVFYYEDIINEPDISPEYYYKYAQALRGVKRYDESREWVEKYLASNGKSRAAQNMLEEDDYGTNTTYTLEEAGFNSVFSDFGVFERGGKMYFVSARAEGVPVKKRVYSWTGEPFLDIYEVNSETNEVSAVMGEVNTKLHDGPAVITPDGNTMYFTRNNYFNHREGKRDKNATNHLKVYKATLSGNSWGNVTELSINHDEYSVGHPALSPDGNTLYFTSDMPGGFGGTDIYKVDINDGVLGDPENLGENINTEQDESFPFIDEDGTLYFSSNGHGGLGFFDIFRVNLKEQNAEVENLGEPVNSNLDDFAFFKSSGQNTGYISSNRSGNDNIYSFNRLNPLVLKGKVTDAINEEPIESATIRIFDEDGNQVSFLETDEDGNYQSEIQRNKELPLEAKQIEYEEFSITIDTRNSDEIEEMEYNISLEPIKDVEYLAEIDNIYFDFDKSNIRKDAAQELDKLVDLMKNEYPDLVIEIGAHTDFRGSEQYNEGLAQRRAQSTRQYLIENGIDENRIYAAKGYGEREPAIDCERCTRKEHQLNRRSMFKVVKMN
ncbi:MAG: OmpA family protein [Salegentibacter sp.]|uniref:WD40-like Beta Propeller Repeat n=1 Tax=Salegentibacter flavus TaxID=287099 RepID=A0A1I5BSL3_9FLAO|nr:MULTISPECIES: OmpA family protein [Salegentibacter]MDR9457663.1 OmpA family protein [Salegentibacter sp.]SFN77725.1 WD40-like Beta Propeller Repeat [Salegentibacter flavus]